MNEPIPAPVQSLLDLFAADLATIKFPDVDAAVLNEAALQVMQQAEAVAHAEAALEVARAALADGQDTLLSRAQRGLAYARVFAESDIILAARLEAINLPRPARRASREAEPAPAPPAAAKRRGRPRKDTASASFFEGARETESEGGESGEAGEQIGVDVLLDPEVASAAQAAE